jgi:hypothetical protein
MQATRSLGFIGVLGACWFVSAGCSSSNNSTNVQPDGGSGGTTGASGGKPGTGGKAAGGASSGGKSGSGGASSGGKSGSGGAGGTNGSGGALEGGTPEGGPEGGVHPLLSKSCGYQCNTDADCLTGTDAGADDTYKCNPTRKRCENPIEVCNSNDDCAGQASLWIPACTGDADCFPGDVCVDAGGYGLCATPADPVDGCSFPPEPIVRRRFGTPDAGTVTVCGSTAGRCNAHRCSIGCSDDPNFCTGAGLGPTCNATSGLCGCATNADCTATGVSVCNGTTHHCECATNADCAGAPGGDVCVNGSCGCSGTSICTVQFRNATSVCE